MRKLTLVTFAVMQFGAMAFGSTMKGWISDASCGAGNANGKPEARECAERCIKSGAAAVFVNDADQKVYKLAGATKVMDHISHKVQIDGDIKGDTVDVKSIKQAE